MLGFWSLTLCYHIHADVSDAERRKRARKAASASLLLFVPRKLLRPQLAMAAHDFEDYFDAVDSALSTGTLTKALRSGVPLVFPLTKLIRSSLIKGYQDGSRILGHSVSDRLITNAESLAQERAKTVAKQMIKTSKKWLKSDPHNEFALSADRAERAARFEGARGYYEGLQKVLWGRGLFKSWFTTSDSPCESCLENEDEGAIPLEEQFPSGDYAPLLHLWCECVLSISGGGL
jgi:hypothetical protein